MTEHSRLRGSAAPKRRLALKALGGSAIAGTLFEQLPGAWQRPVVQAAVLPAHAETSGGLALTVYHEAGVPLDTLRLAYTLEQNDIGQITALHIRRNAQLSYTPALIQAMFPTAYAQTGDLVLREDFELNFNGGRFARAALQLTYIGPEQTNPNSNVCEVMITARLATNRMSLEHLASSAADCTGRNLSIHPVIGGPSSDFDAGPPLPSPFGGTLPPGVTFPPLPPGFTFPPGFTAAPDQAMTTAAPGETSTTTTTTTTTTAEPTTAAPTIPGGEKWYEWTWASAESPVSGSFGHSGDTYYIIGEFRTVSADATLTEDNVYFHQYQVYENGNLLYTVDFEDGTLGSVTPAGGSAIAALNNTSYDFSYDTSGTAFDTGTINLTLIIPGNPDNRTVGLSLSAETNLGGHDGVARVLTLQPTASIIVRQKTSPEDGGVSDMIVPSPVTIGFVQDNSGATIEEGSTLTFRITRTPGAFDVLFDITQTAGETASGFTFEPIPSGATYTAEPFPNSTIRLQNVRIPSTATHIDLTLRAHTDNNDTEADELIRLGLFELKSVSPGTNTEAGPGAVIPLGNHFQFTITNPAPTTTATIPAGERWFTWETTGTSAGTTYTATGEFRFVTANLASAGTVTAGDVYYHMVTVTDGSTTRVADMIPANGTVDGVAGTFKQHTFSMALTAPFTFGTSNTPGCFVSVGASNLVGADAGTSGWFIFLNHSNITAIDSSYPTITEKLTP